MNTSRRFDILRVVKPAVTVKSRIETCDRMTPLDQVGSQNRSDIALHAGHKNVHMILSSRRFCGSLSEIFQGALAVDQSSSRIFFSFNVSIHDQKPLCR